MYFNVQTAPYTHLNPKLNQKIAVGKSLKKILRIFAIGYECKNTLKFVLFIEGSQNLIEALLTYFVLKKNICVSYQYVSKGRLNSHCSLFHAL